MELIVSTGFQSSPENVQTNIAFEVDIRVIDFGLALHFRWFVRIALRYIESERKSSTFVEALQSNIDIVRPFKLMFALHQHNSIEECRSIRFIWHIFDVCQTRKKI